MIAELFLDSYTQMCFQEARPANENFLETSRNDLEKKKKNKSQEKYTSGLLFYC